MFSVLSEGDNMAKMAITEALQEIKTVNSRIAKKRDAVLKYVVRDSRIRDPFASEGGSEEWVRRERQGLKDLEDRIVAIRVHIQISNLSGQVKVQGVSKSVAQWLAWRREVAQGQKQFLGTIAQSIQITRQNIQSKGGKIVAAALASATVNLEKDAPVEVIVTVNEMENLEEIEALEQVLGELDGKLSLFNATTVIDI